MTWIMELLFVYILMIIAVAVTILLSLSVYHIYWVIKQDMK